MAGRIADIDQESGCRRYGGGPRGPCDRVGGLPFEFYSSTSSECSWLESWCSSSWCSCESDEYSDCCRCCRICLEETSMDGCCGLGNEFSPSRGRIGPVQATQGYTVVQNNHNQNNPIQNNGVRQAKQCKTKDVRSPERLEWERGLHMEDVIYYLAKRERHRNDERRRIQDWLKVMEDLDGDNRADKKARYPREERYRDVDVNERGEGGHRMSRRGGDGPYIVDTEDDWREYRHGSGPMLNDGRRRESRRRPSRERMYESGSRYGRHISQERVRGRGGPGVEYRGLRRD